MDDEVHAGGSFGTAPRRPGEHAIGPERADPPIGQAAKPCCDVRSPLRRNSGYLVTLMLHRRRFLQLVGGLGAVGLVVPQLACSGDGEDGDGLPTYSYDGEPGPASTFETGVASGDPHADSVILWTALHPGDLGGGPIELFLEVARDPDFTDRVAASSYETDPDRGYTFKVEATDLEPDTTYYYRWSALGRTSPVGRTRTMPVEMTRLRFAVCSCASYGFGYFHSYGEIGRRADLNLVLHLGDYFYEYAADTVFAGGVRPLEPEVECVELDDYRARLAHYRRDPNLQEAHRQHPWTTIWDDHEFANDPEPGGAENHDPDEGEGDWLERIEAALQAYDEWMPTRSGRDGDIYRRIDCGPMATILLADVQHALLFPGAGDDAPGAEILGGEQADWLRDEIAALGERETPPRYLVLAQAKTFAPKAPTSVEPSFWPDASRAQVLDAVAEAGLEELVVLTGDIHQGQAMDVPRTFETPYDPATGEGSEAVELICMSITSPGFVEDDVEATPHLHWSEVDDKGYMVLDLDLEALQGDFFGTLADRGDLTNPERPEEAHHKSFVGLHGAHHLEETGSPLDPAEDAPPLAP